MERSLDLADRKSSSSNHVPFAMSNRNYSGVVNDQDLGLVLYYHYYPLSEKQSGGDAGNSGYKYAWNQLYWQNGWPSIQPNP